MFLNNVLRPAMLMLAFCGLISCSSGGGNPPPPPAPPSTYTISGAVSGSVTSGVTMNLSNGTSVSTTSNGTFTFTSVANGSYSVTPSASGNTFNPISTSVVVNSANVAGVNFVSTAIPPTTYTVSGIITRAGSVGVLSGVTITMGNFSTVTGTNGSFTFTGVANGNYTVTPTLTGYTFNPASVNLTISGGNVANVNFTAMPVVDNRYSLYWMRISPNALFDDQFATTPVTIEASVSGAGFSLYVKYFNATFDNTLPLTTISLLMSDTGVADSTTSGARIYKVTFTPNIAPRLRFYEHTVDGLIVWLEARDAADKYVQSVNPIVANLTLGVVSRSLAVGTIQLDANTFVTPNMVNVVLSTFDGNYAAFAMKKVYTYYPDVFHTAVIQNIGRTLGINIESGVAVKNTVSGINVPLSDNSAAFGSNGVLSSIEFEMPSDTTNLVLLHEFGHSASFYLNSTGLNLGDNTRFHAAMIGTVGQMGGNYLLSPQTNGDYLITAPDSLGYNSRKFSDLELYLLGFAPASAVQPMWFAKDGSVNYIPGAILPAASTMSVSIDDITRVYGPRTPAFADSQKLFRGIFVGISEKPMTAAEVALMNRIAIYYASGAVGGEIDSKGIFPVRSVPSFTAATNGIGTLVTVLPALK